MRIDTVWKNASLVTLVPSASGADGDRLGIVADGAIAALDGRIVYAGPRADLPAGTAPAGTAIDTIDCGGRWITPGLIDCHTHLVYAGDRAREFELRLAGASYEAVARRGHRFLGERHPPGQRGGARRRFLAAP